MNPTGRKILWVFLLVILLTVLASCSDSQMPTAPAPPTPPPLDSITTATVSPMEERSSPTTPLTLVPDPTAEITPSVSPEVIETQPPQPTPVPSSTAENEQITEDCENKAAFFADVTIPDKTAMQQGQAFVKTWRIRNEGTCSWNSDYTLAFSGGDLLNGPLNAPLPPAAPWEIIDLSIDLTAPNQGGLYTGYYVFEDPQGRRFGVNSGGIDTIWVQISVSWFAPGETASQPEENPAAQAAAPAATAAPAVPGGCSFEKDDSVVAALFTLINQARAAEGLPAFSLDDRLNSAAQAHSTDMGCNNFIDHIGSNGSRWGDRITRQGYAFANASENIYVGNPAFGGGPQGAFDWWMNSPVHRANILSQKATQIGIGYVYVAQSTYGGYYTLNFARPK